MSSSSGSDSGGSSGSSSSFDYESEAYGTPDSINDFSVDEGGSGGDQEAYNDIMETYSPANNKLEAQETIRQQNLEEKNLQDYETQAYQDIPTRAVPQFDNKGKFTGVKTIGDGEDITFITPFQSQQNPIVSKHMTHSFYPFFDNWPKDTVKKIINGDNIEIKNFKLDCPAKLTEISEIIITKMPIEKIKNLNDVYPFFS